MIRRERKSNGSSTPVIIEPTPSGAFLLHQILDYELRSARRYRHFISIAMIISHQEKIDVRQILQSTIRESDRAFAVGERAVILMGHTDQKGALEALERYQSLYNGDADFRYAVVSYPRDGGGSRELLAALERRSTAAERGDSGTVVASG